MFREKRSDTYVSSLEATYNIDLHVRSDMELGSLLRSRGFRSQTQLLKAYRGQLTSHPKKRRVFLSFHSDDLRKVQGVRLMFHNSSLELDLDDTISRRAVRSENESYVKTALRQRIVNSDVVVCIVGNGTGWRDWVDWELKTALEEGIPICGLRIPETYGRIPDLLNDRGAPLGYLEATSITATIECAIARGI
jgi:hypothetical protein